MMFTVRLTKNKILIKFSEKSGFDTEKEKMQNLRGDAPASF